MVTAQRTGYSDSRNINTVSNTKYGRKNWAPGQQSYVQTRHVVKLTKRAFIMVAIIMVGLVSIVCLSAYTSGIRFEINTVSKENKAIKAEIDEMIMLLESDKSITKLEEKALNELGMKYPDPSEIVYLQYHTENINVAEN